MDKNIINDLISSEESLTAIIDFDKKIVEELYSDNNLVDNNLTFEEYGKKACDLKGFEDETGNKLYHFLENFKSNNEDFSFQMTCQFKTGISSVYLVFGALIGDNKYAFSIKKKSKNTRRYFDDLTVLTL